MQENITIARPYAEAAFDTAKSESAMDAWSAMLEILSSIANDKDMQSLISNPRVEKSVLQDIVSEVCGDKVSSQSCKNFIQILIDAGRLMQAPEIHQLFELERAEQEGSAKVEVIAAFPLEQNQQDDIANSMEKRLGKKVVINTEIDESLIGGVVIRSGDSVIDASVKGRLTSLTNEFAE